MRLFLLTILLFSGWGMAQSTSSSSQPSLVELSKQARERKAKREKPARLITNADLKRFQNAPVSISKAATPAAEQTGTEENAPEPGSEEAETAKILDEWRGKFREAVLDYKNAVSKSSVLQLRLNHMTNAYYAQTDDAMRAKFAAEIEQTTIDIDAGKEEIEAALKAIEDLKVEARAAGLEEAEIDAMIGTLPSPAAITDVSEDPEESSPDS
ncbi:MAG TPA: hypothetical protein PLP42_21730 [Acidobacteriota bacterium]|nr:hypothetical protein [Acidobacteriota bacterium]